MTVEDGLPSNTIYSCLQDHRGILWFGTLEGLSSYDTYGFHNFRRDNTDESGNGCIYCIKEDENGILWIGAQDGLLSFDPEQSSFRQIIKSTDIRSLALDPHKKCIWAATLGDGLYRYSMTDESIKHYSIGQNYVPAVLRTEKGEIWAAASDDCLYLFDTEKDVFVPKHIADSRNGSRPQRIFSLAADYSGNIWLAGWDSGIFRFNPQSGVCKGYLNQNGKSEIKGRVHTLYESEAGKLLYGCDDGLYSLDEQGVSTAISRHSDIIGCISDNFVYGVLRDREGGLWVCTYFGGVNYSSPNSPGFSFHTCQDADFRGRIVSCFCENQDGKIWIGTDDGGLFLYNPKTKDRVPVTIDPDKRFLNIHALLMDGDDLWVGTYSDGLYKMSVRTGKTEHHLDFSGNTKQGVNRGESVYSLFKDRSEQLWIGTKEAIYRYDGTQFHSVYEGGFNSDFIDIEEDENGHLWIASIRHGLLMYNPGSGKIMEVSKQKGLPLNLSSLCVFAKTVCYGVPGQGLFAYDINNGQNRQFAGTNRDISQISVSSIINVGDDIWIACSDGILRMNPSTRRIITYGQAEGLQNLYFNTNSALYSSDELLYLGVNGGFNVIQPSALSRNMTPPGVIVSPVPSTIRKGRQLDLHFAATSYASPQNNRYRYRMEGYDNDWLETGWECHSVHYENLQSGNYTFTLSASNNDAIWSEPVHLNIRIVPAWWNSIPAFIIYSLIAIGLLLLGFHLLRSYYLQKKEMRRDRMRIERAKELRTPAMLISAPANEILAMRNLPEKVVQNMKLIKRGSDMLNRLSTEMLDDEGKIKDNLPDYTKQLLQQLEDHNREESIMEKTEGSAQILSDIMSDILKSSSGHTEEHFLEQVGDIIWQNLANEDFTVDALAEKLNLSRSLLFQKIKVFTGKTPNNFIKMIRLHAAAEYIMQGKYRINEICYLTGFGSPSYFAKCFKEEFGVLPKEYSI